MIHSTSIIYFRFWILDLDSETKKPTSIEAFKAILDGNWKVLPFQNMFENIYWDDQVTQIDPKSKKLCVPARYLNLITPFLPAILAIKVKNILNLESKVNGDYRNLVIAAKGDRGGRLDDWKRAYPHLLEEIASNNLGYKPKKFRQILNEE